MLHAIFFGTALLAAIPVHSPTCSLSLEAGVWNGPCAGLIEDADAQIVLHAADAIVSGAWRRDAKPESVWSGTVATSEYPKTPVEVEIYNDADGVMRTVFGWFPVSHFSKATGAIRFDVDPSREVAPSSVDREIIGRASRILSTSSAWNRADNRKCPEGAATWSIYCAMEKATIEVSGAFHHRRPALEVVRRIVDERTRGRPYEHRLMDYNNDPTTRLSDVRSLFEQAMRRIEAEERNRAGAAKTRSR
jgi:hypothetical protein